MPSQTNTERQPISTSTAASAAIMTSWPRHMPRDHGRVGEAGAAREGARHHHAHRRQRGHAVADGEHDAVEQHRVPRLGDQAHEADADAADDHAGVEQQARAGAVRQPAGEIGGNAETTR